MNQTPTSGDWRASALCRSTADWPFDWVAEITTVDTASRTHAFVATIRQSGVRRVDEALANVRIMVRASAMLRLVARQSGSESPTIRIRIRDCDVAIVFLLFVAGKRYV